MQSWYTVKMGKEGRLSGEGTCRFANWRREFCVIYDVGSLLEGRSCLGNLSLVMNRYWEKQQWGIGRKPKESGLCGTDSRNRGGGTLQREIVRKVLY